MTKLDLYTATDSHSITLDFKTLDGLRDALKGDILALSSRGQEELDNFMTFYTMGTTATRSIYNDMVQLYKLEDGAIIVMNMTQPNITTARLLEPTDLNTKFMYDRHNQSFRKEA